MYDGLVCVLDSLADNENFICCGSITSESKLAVHDQTFIGVTQSWADKLSPMIATF